MKKFLVIALTLIVIISSGCASLSLSKKQELAYRSSLAKGEKYLKASKYEEAVNEFIKAIELGKKIHKEKFAKALLGETYLRKGDFVSAKVIAQDLTAKLPNESIGWELLGKIHLKTNRLKEAEDCFQKALVNSSKQSKERIESLLALTQGLISYSKGDVKAAKKFWIKISDKDLAKEVTDKARKILKVEVKD